MQGRESRSGVAVQKRLLIWYGCTEQIVDLVWKRKLINLRLPACVCVCVCEIALPWASYAAVEGSSPLMVSHTHTGEVIKTGPPV